MGGKQKQEQSQTTRTILPANQQRNIDLLMNEARNYYNSGGRQFYQGDMVADFNPYQTAGQQYMLDYAGGVGQDLVNNAMAGNNYFLDPNNIMSPENMPGFQGTVDAVQRTFTDNLLRNILPSVRGGGTSSGQYGGSASGIGQALATSEATKNIADSIAPMYMDAYGRGLDMFNQAQNRAPSLFALGAAPGTIMGQVGDATQAQQQREIDADVMKWNFAQNEPIQLLSLLQSLTGSAGQYGGTTQSNSTTSTSGGGNPLGQALGIGMMLMGMPGPGASMLAGGSGAGKGGATGEGGAVNPFGSSGTSVPSWFQIGSTPGP